MTMTRSVVDAIDALRRYVECSVLLGTQCGRDPCVFAHVCVMIRDVSPDSANVANRHELTCLSLGNGSNI